jgi:tetratricopeptide (TPR) repeat protein
MLSEQEFTAAVREQAEEQLLETFRWTSGAFHYFPDKHVRADVALDIDRGAVGLILEGVRHWSPHGVVAEALRPRASLYVSKVEEPPCEIAELDLSSSERVFFEHLYGDRSVREVLDSGDLDARTLYGLFAAGLLVLHEEPVMMLLDAAPVMEEAPRDVVLEAPQPEASKPAPEPPPTREPASEPPPTPEPAPELPPIPEPVPELPPIREPVPELPPTRSPAPEPPPTPAPVPELPPARSPAPEPPPTPEPVPELPPTREPAPKPPSTREPVPELPPTRSPVPEPPPTPPAKSLAPAWKAERTLAELTAFCEHIRDGDDFDVLGIGVNATDAAVRTAYEELIDTLLPSEAASAALPGLKELADEARNRIDKSFDRLRLRSSREVYAQLRPQVAKDRKEVPAAKTPEQIAAEKAAHLEELASRGLDAEAWFRRGDGFLEAKSYDQAVEAYGMAAHLDPKEGEYLARLGYAQFLNKPKDAVVLQEALENLARGIKLSPNREKPYVYLGKIFRANGAVDRARKMFENAVRIKPGCHEALEELGRMDQGKAKGGKLIGRLKDILT